MENSKNQENSET